jgi:hypothetical protein
MSSWMQFDLCESFLQKNKNKRRKNVNKSETHLIWHENTEKINEIEDVLMKWSLKVSLTKLICTNFTSFGGNFYEK